ncbi:hypothetical protein V5F77_00390 [Xanthobacter sp. DSM 24535]|uniref:hypothetical protein n=1 Tax=Roseixanthobacter psychrophilus TaxID=3119917 RepID=UPI0037276B96
MGVLEFKVVLKKNPAPKTGIAAAPTRPDRPQTQCLRQMFHVKHFPGQEEQA